MINKVLVIAISSLVGLTTTNNFSHTPNYSYSDGYESGLVDGYDNGYFESFLGNQKYFSELSLDYDILINQRKRVTVSFTINEPSLDFDTFINYYKYLSLPEDAVIGKLYYKWNISPTYYELNLDKFFYLSTGFAVPDNNEPLSDVFYDMFVDSDINDKIDIKVDFVISQSVDFTMAHTRALIFTDNLYLYFQDNGFSYSDVYSKGFEDGENFGYNIGFDDGYLSTEDGGVWNSLFMAVLAPFALLEIEIFPGVSLGAIALIPIIFGLIAFIFKLGGKGGD